MTFEEELNEHGRFLFTSKGASMRPLIRQERDVLEIAVPHAPLQRYDVVLYKDRGGRYILHRILRVHDDCFDLLGDNNCRMERGVRREQILGVLTAVLRDGTRRVELSSLPCRVYAALWCGLYPVRIGLLRLIQTAKSLCRKILRRD